MSTEENAGFITPQQLKEAIAQSTEALRTELSDSITGATNKAQKASLKRMETFMQEQLSPLTKILNQQTTPPTGEVTPQAAAEAEDPSPANADIPADNPLAQRLMAMTAQMEEQQRVIQQSQAQQQKFIELAEAQQKLAQQERSQRLLTEANATFSGTARDTLYDPKVFIQTAKNVYGLPIELDVQKIETPEGSIEKAEWVYTKTDQYDQRQKMPLGDMLPDLLKDRRFEYMAKGRSGSGTGTSSPGQNPAPQPPQDETAPVDFFSTVKGESDPITAMISSIQEAQQQQQL